MSFTSKIHRGLGLASRIGLRGIARRASYRAYCRKHGLDFSSETHEEIGISRADGVEHTATGGADLEEAFEMLGLTNKFNSVLDIGCGKGAALVTFHRLGIGELAGIELSPKMLTSCLKNMERMNLKADLMGINATTFSAYEKYDLIYNFNAIPRAPLSIVIDNIVDSASRSGKEHHVLLANYQDSNQDLLNRPEIKFVGRADRTMPYLYLRVSPL